MDKISIGLFFTVTYQAVQLMKHLQDAHVARADVFRDVLQVVGFGPVEARNLVLGNLDAVLWTGLSAIPA